MNPKYKLIPSDVASLFWVVALRDFSNVKAGELGGYVSSEHNLSQQGECWIYPEGAVINDAYICDNAQVFGGFVGDQATIWGEAQIHADVAILGRAIVIGTTLYGPNMVVFGDAQIKGSFVLYGPKKIGGSAKITSIDQTYGKNIFL